MPSLVQARRQSNVKQRAIAASQDFAGHDPGITRAPSADGANSRKFDDSRHRTLETLLRKINDTVPLRDRSDLSSFVNWKGNAEAPIHRWLRYREAYSPNLITKLGLGDNILDPFRKRQTGNDPAYGRFLDWYKQWSFDASHSSPDESENLVELLLAFPPGDFFCDRVFEIWCLHQVIESFRRCGAVIADGPRPLSERSDRSICAMHYEGYTSKIWFQKALPTTAAKWKYLHSQKSLVGIPDITVIGNDGRRLLIDAKRREVQSLTRSEETYKMLGYLENFRNIFQAVPFWGALCFLSNTDLFTEIVADGNHRIVLVGAHVNNPRICAFGGRMDTLVSEWLSQRQLGRFEGVTVPNQLM